MDKEKELLLTDTERAEVYIPCEIKCGHTMPKMLDSPEHTTECMECMVICHEKAQHAKTKAHYEAEIRGIIEELEANIIEARVKQGEAMADTNNENSYNNASYYLGHEHANRNIKQAIKSHYIEGK